MTYANIKRVSFGDENDNIGMAVFVPVCEKCGRFVKAHGTIDANEINGLRDKPNATCGRCGETKMLFEGFF